MAYTDSHGHIIDYYPQPIAKGGEGVIYRLCDKQYPDCCLKILGENKLSSRLSKLKYMIKQPIGDNQSSLYRICWPRELVYESKHAIGFIMPLAFSNSHSLYSLCTNKNNNRLFSRSSQAGMLNRLKLLYNLANAIECLHQLGYTIVDFKPQNVLFSDSGQISIIDIDSIQIDAIPSYLATAITAEYAFPKEMNLFLEKKSVSSEWDAYSFSIVAYQLLLGIHPFTATTIPELGFTSWPELMAHNLFPFGNRSSDITACPPPQYYFYLLPKAIQSVFCEAFDLEQASPDMRRWKKVIITVVNDEGIKENPFWATPQKPVFIPISIPKNEDLIPGQSITFQWRCFFCSSLIINGVQCVNQSQIELSVQSDSIFSINILATNSLGESSFIYSITKLSSFCIYCGHKFEPDDKHCIICGRKRL